MSEPPADITGISMEMREQKLRRVEVTPYHPEPAADISDYKMETIRDPGGTGALLAFTVLVAGLLIFVLVLS